MNLTEADIVECKFCGGSLKPIKDRRAPYGFGFFRCVDCGNSNVIAMPQKPAISA
jgi:hypothetical protein